MITVWSGSSPPPLEPLAVPELAHLEVFTSRSSEEGRQRYRLHVGYFDDPSAAERVLPRVREIYPCAWVVPASRHRPLVRMPAAAPHAWTADPPAARTAEAQLPRATFPAQPAEAEFPAVDPANAEASGSTAQSWPTGSRALADEISLDVSEILALLEESDSRAPAFADCLAADLRAEASLEGVDLAALDSVIDVDAPAATPVLRLSAAGPVPALAAPPAASAEPMSAFSRFSVEVWCPEPPAAAQTPVARSWLKRLPKLTRLAARRRTTN
jgi:hypothetical protein